MTQVIDPLKFKDLMWPDVTFASYQQDIIYSVMENDETFVPAGNMLGKDFVAAFIVLWYFESRNPCKILLTSVKDMHLDILWGEIDKFIRISKHSMIHGQGGNLIITDRKIKKVVDGIVRKDTYIERAVANEQSKQSFQGFHATPDPVAGQELDDGIPRNLIAMDEASGLPNLYWEMTRPVAKRSLAFGNTWPCENFFKHGVMGKPGTKDKGGDIPDPNIPGRFYRKVIKITADESPNVRHGKALVKRHGKEIMSRRGFMKSTTIVAGILTFAEYLKRREMWEPMEQCVSLDADWYEGAEEKLFPAPWLNLAEKYAETNWNKHTAKTTLGVDSAEGGDDTAWCVMNAFGIIHLESFKTEDTTIIVSRTLALMREYNIKPENVVFDRGGGGQQHADRLRQMGHAVTTVGFGEPVSPEKKRGMTPLEKRKLEDETRYVYKMRNAQMYHLLSLRLMPDKVMVKGSDGKEKENLVGNFAIPREYSELRRQLAPIPKWYDDVGRIFIPPKNKKPGTTKGDTNTITLKGLLGCSPDQADAAAMAAYRLEYKGRSFVKAGGVS